MCQDNWRLRSEDSAANRLCTWDRRCKIVLDQKTEVDVRFSLWKGRGKVVPAFSLENMTRANTKLSPDDDLSKCDMRYGLLCCDPAGIFDLYNVPINVESLEDRNEDAKRNCSTRCSLRERMGKAITKKGRHNNRRTNDQKRGETRVLLSHTTPSSMFLGALV